MAEETRDHLEDATPAGDAGDMDGKAPAGDAAPDGGKAPRAKRDRRVVAGIVAAAVVVLAIGFGAWHSTPQFCNAVCHVPMDAFTDAAIEGTHDVYGNEVSGAESLAMTAYYHLNEEGVDCLSCHTPTLGEQVSEGVKWVTGDYYVQGQNSQGQWVLNEMTTADFAALHASDDGDGFCLRAGCHTDADGNDILTREQLEAATAGLSATRNPHHTEHDAREHETLDCSSCHKGHSQSVNYCSSCHDDAPIPDGWLTYGESLSKHSL